MFNRHFAIAVCVLAALSGLQVQAGETDKIVVAEFVAPMAGWALETDDAELLSRAGCVEPLTRIDFEGQLQPLLAVSWKQTEPTVWEFTLRDGVTFQDGQPLTAEAVASALKRLLAAAAPPRAFSPKSVASVEAVGDKIVKITTPEPSVLLPLRLAAPATGILSPAAFKDGKVNPVGTCTGPFKIVEEIPQQAIMLEANKNYWGGPVALEKAEVRFVPDGNVRATQVRTGESQIATAIPVVIQSQLESAQGVVLEKRNLPRTTGLYLNYSKPPFNDVRVRRAVQSALDTAAIAASLYEGVVKPAIGPFAPGEPWAPSDEQAITPDIDKAKALLAEAGIKPGTLKLLLLAYSERPELPDLAAIIQDRLKLTGIDVEIRSASYNALEPDMMAGNFDMALMSRSHLTDVADPAGFLEADYTCSGGFNISHFCDQELDAQVRQAVGEVDPAKRFEIYKALARKLQDDAITVFIVHEEAAHAVSDRVQNYRIHPLDHVLLSKDISLK